jgi:hypothetical protein
MSRTARLLMFGVGAAGLGVVLVYGLGGIPAFGHYLGVYGRVLDGIGVAQRHATNLVTASTSTSGRSTRSARNSSCSPRCSGSC